jgi:DNA-binding CsgD family transcriptional regulator
MHRGRLGASFGPHCYNTENASEGGNGTPDRNDNGKHGYETHITDDRADDGNDDDTDDDAESGEKAFPAKDNNNAPRLSARQKLILRYLINGDPDKTIARKIQITEATIKVHVKAILRKIRVHNLTQATIWVMNNRTFIQQRMTSHLPCRRYRYSRFQV